VKQPVSSPRRKPPNLEYELAARRAVNIRYVVGLDEAGRGAIAGPVVAGAVILPLDNPGLRSALAGVNDSKQLSSTRRQELRQQVLEHALSAATGTASSAEIDQYGIIPATKLAMRRALEQLDPQPEFLLIDGRLRLAQDARPQQSIIRGDSKSLSIAAASILAKEARDEMMRILDGEYAGLGLGQHKGYCTAGHLAALARIGATPQHRYSFAPLKLGLFNLDG